MCEVNEEKSGKRCQGYEAIKETVKRLNAAKKQPLKMDFVSWGLFIQFVYLYISSCR